MAGFTRDTFSGSVGAGSAGPSLYVYSSAADNKATVIADDYFVGLIGIVEVGDFILATASDASVLLVVTKSDAAEVDTGYVAVA